MTKDDLKSALKEARAEIRDLRKRLAALEEVEAESTYDAAAWHQIRGAR